MSFGLIPVAVGVFVVDEQRGSSVEHQLFVGQVLIVQVPDAVKIAQASLKTIFSQILTLGRKEIKEKRNFQLTEFLIYGRNNNHTHTWILRKESAILEWSW